MERRCGIGMLGWRQGTPMWEYDPVRSYDGPCRRTGHEEDSPLEGSLTMGGADRRDGNNSSVTISDRSYACSGH